MELSRRFAVNVQETSPIEALEQSNKETLENELQLENEIRVKTSPKSNDTFKPEHPFFWAGNMLIDLNGYKPAVVANAESSAVGSDNKNADEHAEVEAAAGSGAKESDDPFIGEPKEAESEDQGSGAKEEKEEPEPTPEGSEPKESPQEPSEGSGGR